MPTTRGSAPTAINYNTNSSSSSTPSSSTTSPAHRQSTGLDAGDVLSDNYEQGCDGCIIIGLGLRGSDFDSQPSPATSRSLDSSIAVDDSHVDCSRRFACRSPFTIQMPRGCAFAGESALVQGQAVINCGAEPEHAPQYFASVPARLPSYQSCSLSSRRASTWVLVEGWPLGCSLRAAACVHACIA